MTKYSQTKLIRKAITNEIRVLEGLNLETAHEKDVEKLLSKLLGHGRIERILNVRSPQAFRVRINEEGKLFESVRDLWWPPPECVKRGRCNDQGQPVFYYSDSEETAIIEKQPNKGDVITVLTSELIAPTKMPSAVSVGVHEYSGKSNPNYGGTPPARDQSYKSYLGSKDFQKSRHF